MPNSAPGEAVHFAKTKVNQAPSGSVLYDGKTYRVQMSRRAEAGQPELHTKDSDVFYIIAGAATFVVGGKIVDAKSTAPGEFRGTSIEGGKTIQLAQGDVIVIPDNVAHWFKQVQEPMVYFVMKEVTGK